MKRIITAAQSDYLSPLVTKLREELDIHFCTTDDVIGLGDTIVQGDQIYLPSDTIYAAIQPHFDRYWQALIEPFRDKYQFRQKLSAQFPDFFFDKVSLSALADYSFDFAKSSRYIVKPTIGFMAGGTKVIDAKSDLSVVAAEISTELAAFNQLYPNIFSDELIIEAHIGDGEELAVDMYYDCDGKPVILNIYSHPMATNPAYAQLLYYTGKAVFDRYYQTLIEFFSTFNANNEIRQFPIHAEFKLDAKGQLVPIEFNVCRFGGMGLADLTQYAFSFDAVKAYFDEAHIDWSEQLASKGDEYYGWFLAYNPTDGVPDHDAFRGWFSNHAKILAYQKLDHTRLPAFAIVYFCAQKPKMLQALLDF